MSDTARAVEIIFDRSGHNQICHHCLCGASTHTVCKAHVHAKHANCKGACPPRKFLNITPSKIESEGIFSDVIVNVHVSI